MKKYLASDVVNYIVALADLLSNDIVDSGSIKHINKVHKKYNIDTDFSKGLLKEVAAERKFVIKGNSIFKDVYNLVFNHLDRDVYSGDGYCKFNKTANKSFVAAYYFGLKVMFNLEDDLKRFFISKVDKQIVFIKE